jgi:hypothetical protein
MATEYDFDVVRIHGTEHAGSFEVSSDLLGSGWVGGTWIKYQRMESWRDGNEIRWKRVVETAGPEDPMHFILRASYEGTDQYTGRYPGKTGVVVCCDYGMYLFKYYETVNKQERDHPGTGAALTYTLNTNVYVSDRGLITSEREAGVSSRGIGLVIGVPDDNIGYLGVDVLIGPW